jgi:nucleoside-diphosphate-sugar epimerase
LGKEMSRVLLTGINSPLGQAIGRKLQAEGHSVIGTLRSSKINTHGLPADDLIPLDLEDELTFLNITESYDAFVHVAGMSTGSATEMMTSTALGSHHLISRARDLSIPRFIHISSMAVYGLGTEQIIGEKSPISHSHAYHAARWAAECYVKSERDQVEAVSIRPPAIAGTSTHNHFLSKILEKMFSQDATINATNPDFRFNNIVHEDAIAEFVSTLLDAESLPTYRAVPIGSTDPIPLREIIDVMAKATNYTGQINWVQPKTPPFRIDSSGAIELGYKPITTLETINRWMHDAIDTSNMQG